MYNRSVIYLGFAFLVATAPSGSAAGISTISLKSMAIYSSSETENLIHQVAKRKKIQKRVDVRGSKQFRRVLSARGKDKQAVVISCMPASSDWCATGFVEGCTNNGGIGSSKPGGGHVCSFPDID